jgi:hypothetical protein
MKMMYSFLSGLMIGAGLTGFFMTALIVDHPGVLPWLWFALFLLGGLVTMLSKTSNQNLDSCVLLDECPNCGNPYDSFFGRDTCTICGESLLTQKEQLVEAQKIRDSYLSVELDTKRTHP